jgi:hypothetical protein
MLERVVLIVGRITSGGEEGNLSRVPLSPTGIDAKAEPEGKRGTLPGFP